MVCDVVVVVEFIGDDGCIILGSGVGVGVGYDITGEIVCDIVGCAGNGGRVVRIDQALNLVG